MRQQSPDHTTETTRNFCQQSVGPIPSPPQFLFNCRTRLLQAHLNRISLSSDEICRLYQASTHVVKSSAEIPILNLIPDSTIDLIRHHCRQMIETKERYFFFYQNN